jgi:methionine-gamma-lyase
MGGVVIGRGKVSRHSADVPQGFRRRALAQGRLAGAGVRTPDTVTARAAADFKTSMVIAEFLEKHPKVRSVSYPGLPSFPQYELARKQMRDYDGEFAPGALMYFALKSDSPQDSRDKGEKLINYCADNAYTITLAVSLGHTRTLIEHPGSMTHSAIPAEEQVQRGMDPGGVRLSIGIEHPDDIIRDLEEALAQI